MKMSAEMVVVDDNSLDGTDIVCSKLGKQYPLRLIIWQMKKDDFTLKP
jgi:glycosyltransferase involved in cell wall biosynthesis